MGYTTRNNGQITDFWPDDTDKEFYICEGAGLGLILEHAKSKFGDAIDINDLCIESEYIHTHCLYYDQYDGGDWTRFLKISI